jgi:cold shock CspA family protein
LELPFDYIGIEHFDGYGELYTPKGKPKYIGNWNKNGATTEAGSYAYYTGYVMNYFEEKDYGFIKPISEINNMRSIFFHINSIEKNPFGKLKKGTFAIFELKETKRGPQADKIILGETLQELIDLVNK